MRNLITVLIALLLVGSVAYAKDFEVSKKAGQYTVEVKIDKNPPVVGDNNMKIEIKDSSNKHVTDAKVRVDYSMAAMPGMPPMNYKTDGELKGNEYTAKMSLSMAGPWNIDVKFKRPGGSVEKISFSVDAR